MKANRTNPVLNRPNTGQNSREFLKNLEELMKRNTGSFGNMAFDVGSNKPYRVGGRVKPETVETPSMGWQPGVLPATQSAQLLQTQRPEQPNLPDYSVGQLPQNPTAQEMLQAIFEEAWKPQLPTTEQLDQRYQQTGEAYPIMSMADGTVKYSDGSIRQADQSQPPMPIASMADGTVLWSDGFTREMPPGGLARYMAGVNGLSEFIFGQDQTVTQPFGNVNPGMGYASNTHRGVDFRTKDLQQRNLFTPVPMRVVQIITADSGSPYGNSVLLELPSGEMLRLSHLASIGQFIEGQVLNPGDTIGTPGNTGNSTGEHLDVEYYNKDGQLDNPNSFKTNASQYSMSNQVMGISPYSPTQSINQQRSTQPQPTTPQSPSFGDTTLPTTISPQRVTEAVGQALRPAGQAFADTVNKANPTGKMGIGLTELATGDVLGARTEQANTIEKVGQQFNIPEMQVSEATKEGGLTGAVRQLAGNVVDFTSTPLKKLGVPDFGISEKIAGGSTINTGANFLPANASEGQNFSKAPTRQDYANVLDQNIQSVGNEIQTKAGEGINALKSAGQGVKNLIQTGIDKLTPKRVVGDQSGSVAEEVGQTTQKVMSQGKNDIRDPFFKMGGAQMYSKYLAPNAQDKSGGALTLDLFSPDFFQNPDNIANVFGSTGMGKEATDKYRSYEASKYPLTSFSPINYEEGYNKDELDKYNKTGSEQASKYNKTILDYLKSIPSVLTSAFSFQDAPKPTSQRLSFGSITKSDSAPKMSYAINPQMSFDRKAPQQSVVPQQSMAQMSFARSNAPTLALPTLSALQKPVYAPSLESYLSRGKTPEQWYAETGRQGEADRVGGAQNAANAYFDAKAQAYRQNEASQNSSQNPQAVQGAAVSDAIMAAGQGKPFISNSGNVIPNYTPAKANMSDAGTGLPVVAKNRPYPIMSMADGRVKYSDGSIR